MSDSNYIVSKLQSYGVPSNQAAILAAVAYAESSYQADQIGDIEYGGSVGLFQINLPAHASELTQWTGSPDTQIQTAWLQNVDNNIYAASQVYFSQGLSAWTEYRNGDYLQYLNQNYTINESSFSSGYTSGNIDKFISIAQAQLGKPYVYGASGPGSFDCSGLVSYVWDQMGLSIARTTYEQWPSLQHIDSSGIQIGDLLYQNFDSQGPGHVGIYLGNDTVIAAPHVGANVRTYTLSEFGTFSAARDPAMTSLLSGNSSFAGGLGPLTNLPATNYAVVPGSEQSSDVLYGRKYRIIVSNLAGNVALDVSNLHVTFNVVKVIQMQPQYSHVVIYNLSPQTENAIINEGDRVVIEAGYVGSQYGQIFDGNVIQTVRDKPDGSTYTLTLVCADSDMFLSYSLSAFSMFKGQNSRSVIKNLINTASVPTSEGVISSGLSESALTRGKVVFGLTRDYLRQIAKSENASYYMENGSVNIIKADDLPQDEIIELSPSSGLIGVPAQSDYGVTIRSLMNPRIRLGSMIYVDNSLIHNEEYAQGQVPYSLDNDGIYRAIKVTYIGDTRGTDWYVETESITQSGILPAMVANGSQSAW